MSEPRDPLRSVCIAGGGQVGVLAAIGVKRALPGCEVTVIGLPPGPLDFADHAASALPFTNKLHDRLGISEEAIVAQAGGSHRLILRCIGWGGEGQHGAASYGGFVDSSAAVAFGREWGGGSRSASALQVPGSLAEILADSGRFRSLAPGEGGPLAEIDYALRWNPAAYRGLLIAEAQRLGIGHVEAAVEGAELSEDGGIASLRLSGSRTVEADLFLDCSGAAQALLSLHPDHGVADWTDILPERRVLFAAPGQGMLALEDRLSLLPEGWLLEFAGRDGLQVVLGAAPRVDDPQLTRALGGEPAFDARVSSGRASAPWLGNVVALGDAAARFEPLGYLQLDLAHRMLALLLEILPGRQIEPLERREFNRRAVQIMDGARDLLAMFYATPRAGQVFGEGEKPATVTDSIDQFTRRGRLPFREESPLAGPEMMSLLRALGFAQAVPPQERASDPRRAASAGKGFEAKAQASLKAAPPYAEWMSAMLRR